MIIEDYQMNHMINSILNANRMPDRAKHINHMLERSGSNQRVKDSDFTSMLPLVEIFNHLVDRIEALEAKLSEAKT